MCGIAGIITNSSENSSQKKLNGMLRELKHRGPDGKGLNKDEYVLLGMDRLAIIDLSGGMQPLYNEDNSIEIVGNGEIYNYVELQRKLKMRHHHLKTSSDIETAAHLYEEYGENFVQHLRGMFALAIYDKKKKRLILVRDRMGEKPLYYLYNNNNFYFASEFKALQNIVRSKELDVDSINLYFHYSYIPEPRTLLKDIHKLPAAHFLIFNLLENSYEIKRYWDPNSIEPQITANPEKVFMQLIEESCNLNLRADVDVGLSLSGGLDSGAILALSAPKYGKQMKAFTVGYEGSPKSDERKYAEMLTEKYHIKHFQYEITTKEVVDSFPWLVYMTDDPIADIAAYAVYSVSRLARSNNIKVLLGGVGGDELFWGYKWTREAVENSVKENNGKLSFYDKTPLYKVGSQLIRKLYGKEMHENVNSNLPQNIFQPTSLLKNEKDYAKRAMSAIRDIWLVSDPIALGDRMSMASSVELRSPFLDYQLVESAYSYQQNVLAYKLPHKYWLKKILEGVVPNEILNMPKKGFTPPVAEWFYQIINKYSYLLNDGFLIQQKILSPLNLRLATQMWKALPSLWQAYYELIFLEIYCREYIWGNTPEEILNAKK